jgi:hypothetical protein
VGFEQTARNNVLYSTLHELCMNRQQWVDLNNEESKAKQFWALKHLKPKLVQIILNNAVRTTKKTQHFSITNINWLTLFKEITPVSTEIYETHKYKMKSY